MPLDDLRYKTAIDDTDIFLLQRIRERDSFREMATKINRSGTTIQIRVNWMVINGYLVKPDGLAHRSYKLTAKGKELISKFERED